MTGNRVFAFGLILAAALFFMLACQGKGPNPKAESESITVAAAADLQFAFTEVSELYYRETGSKVVLTFGSSGTLAKQIENGAPVDVFASANIQYIDDLRARDMLIGDTQQNYATGRIVLAGNKRSGVELSDLNDLLRPEIKRVAIANPDHAPYGVAAKQALVAKGVWDQAKSKLVYGEDVRQTLQYVQTGNAEAGIVSLSVARSPEIDYILIDDSLHQPLVQAIAVVSGSKHEQASREFIAFVNGSLGRPIMEKYGFLPPASRAR